MNMWYRKWWMFPLNDTEVAKLKLNDIRQRLDEVKKMCRSDDSRGSDVWTKIEKVQTTLAEVEKIVDAQWNVMDSFLETLTKHSNKPLTVVKIGSVYYVEIEFIESDDEKDKYSGIEEMEEMEDDDDD